MNSAAVGVSPAALRAIEDSNVNPGLLGFVVVALLGVATWLLIRSMTRSLRRVDVSRAGPPDATAGKDEAPGARDAGPDDPPRPSRQPLR